MSSTLLEIAITCLVVVLGIGLAQAGVKTEEDKLIPAESIAERLQAPPPTILKESSGVRKRESRDPIVQQAAGGVRVSTVTFNNILFEFGSDELRAESIPQLDEIGKALVTLCRDKNAKFLIVGHTDNIGGDDYNLKLSEQRAKAVKRYLVEGFSISPSKLKAVGYGKRKPIDNNNTEEGRSKNRRVEIVRQ
jgi:outer membrane protein OmpA-like peptidoglycan-associated protein